MRSGIRQMKLLGYLFYIRVSCRPHYHSAWHVIKILQVSMSSQTPFLGLPIKECLRVSSQRHISTCGMRWEDNSCVAIFTPFTRNGSICTANVAMTVKKREMDGEEIRKRMEIESKWMDWRGDRRSLCESDRSSLTNPWAVKQWM